MLMQSGGCIHARAIEGAATAACNHSQPIGRCDAKAHHCQPRTQVGNNHYGLQVKPMAPFSTPTGPALGNDRATPNVANPWSLCPCS